MDILIMLLFISMLILGLTRKGGDEFIMIFENISTKEAVENPAGKIQAVFSQPFELNAQTLTITASIGFSLYPGDTLNSETLLKYADIAMHTAKRERNNICFFDDRKDNL